MATQNQILEQLKILEKLYNRGEVSEVVERALTKIIAHEITIAQQEVAELETDLKLYERQYQIGRASCRERVLMPV